MTLTPWIAGAMTTALCAGFSMPLGRERDYRTTYSGFAGLSARFAPPPQAPALPDSAHTQATAMPPQDIPPSPPMGAPEAVTEAGRPGRPTRAGRRLLGHRRRPIDRRNAATVSVSTSAEPRPDQTPIAVASPLEGMPETALRPAPVEPDDSPEGLRDAFEADPSKFPLDAKVWADGVFLQLVGLCRVKGRYILKTAVTNRSGADFFVKEFGAYNGEDLISLRSYIRLFVEPGRTREGYVLFAPPSGAEVKIKLKEDRERGRVLEVPVRYPF